MKMELGHYCRLALVPNQFCFRNAILSALGMNSPWKMNADWLLPWHHF